MSKLAIGCVGLLAVGVVGAAGASYFAYQKVTSAVAPISGLASLPEIEASIRKQAPYTPPAAGEPSPAQVERLLEVQHAVRARLGTQADEFYQRYRPYFEPVDGEAAWVGGTVDSALVTIRFYRDLAGVYVEGKRAQMDALNRTGLSLQEYRWTRSQVYGALGIQLLELDIARIIADVKEGREPAATADRLTADRTPSPAMRKLVEPHQKVLKENVVLAFFGL